MKKVLYKLKIYYKNSATDVEKPVIQYILKNPREVIEMDIHTLAKKGYCSAATIVRIAKKNGLDGFKSLKLALMNDINVDDDLINNAIISIDDENVDTIFSRIFNENIKSLHETYNLIDTEEIIEIVDLIDKVSIIRLFGIGASYLVAKDFQQKLERINIESVLYEDLHMQMISAHNSKPNDLCFIISYSGQTREMVQIANSIKQGGGKYISITKYNNNKVANMADYSLFVPNIEGEIRLGAGSSRISQLTLIDVIYNLYYRKQKEKLNDHILSTKKMLEKLKK